MELGWAFGPPGELRVIKDGDDPDRRGGSHEDCIE